MTKREYLSAYRSVRKATPRQIRTAMTQVKKAYITAAEEVADKVRIAELAGVSDFTTHSWKQIELQLAQAIEGVTEVLDEEATQAVGNMASRVTAIDQKYLTDVSDVLDGVKISNMYVRVNEELITHMATRLFADGYTYSERIWRVGELFQTDMKQVLLAGLSQGRDPVEIAEDLTRYVAEGKVKLMKRYGKLEAGTRDFVKRIPRNVDYRAMRLVRTELYSTLKEAGILAGERNPGALDLYDWVMQSGRADWDCECPDYARGSPYTAAQVPVQPHPNCGCYVVAHLRDRDEFVDDLARWADGESVDYLDEWAEKYYDVLS